MILFTQSSVDATHIVEKQEIHCHTKIFTSNKLTVRFFSKTLIWRKFCEKTVAVNFRKFHSVYNSNF